MFSAGERCAARAASIAVLPPPTTATLPSGGTGAFSAFMSHSQSMTGTTLPGILQMARPFPGAYGEEDMGIALGLELCNGGGRGIQADLHAHLLHQRHVVVDGVVRDAEGGDHLAHDAAQRVLVRSKSVTSIPARPRK